MNSIGIATGLMAGLLGTSLCLAQTRGPDVIVGDLPETSHWGPVNGMHAYAVGTTSCNIGDQELNWISGTNQHPVIAQHMYRLDANGRFVQLGQSWLKHGFFALSGSLCGSCNGTSGSTLGVGCSDPYGSGLNGSQSGLGPKFEVNPSTGVFAYPFSNPDGNSGDAIFKRLQVAQSDLDVAGAMYFVEGHYIAQDDALANNDNNNASYRRVTVNNNFTLSMQGATEREKPAIYAWRDHGNGPNMIDENVLVSPSDVINDGRFIFGSRAFDNGDGTWRYEFAVHNLNSDRAGGSLRVTVPVGATVTDVGFHDVNYHSGEPFAPEPWQWRVEPGSVVWETPERGAVNPNTNALRWGTTYSFWMTTDVPPSRDTATLGIFRPAPVVNSIPMVGNVPDKNFSFNTCPCDWLGEGTLNSDDFFAFIDDFFGGDADFDGNNLTNSDDFFSFIDCFFAGC